MGHSSLDHSISGHFISGHSLSRHASPDNTVADSSTPPRFVHPSLARTPRCSEAYLRWRSAPLSTMYPPTTFESSARDSSFKSSAGPSRKRCRFPAATMTSSIHVMRALVHSRVDLLPQRKRFRDSTSPEDSVEEDIDTDVLEDIEADAMAVEVAVDRDVVTGVDACIDMEVDVGIDVEDEVESSDRGTMEVGVDVATGIDIPDVGLSVVIERRVEDLQLGVESYQKKLNLTKPDTYRSNLRRKDAYTPYSDPRGFIYENKDKKNRLMRIDELHKFSDGTLDDVRTALNDRLKGIRMEYLPQTFWSQRDKVNARAMIQAIDKRLKTRRIFRSLERFVGGRPYGDDLRLLQRTI
ncbi:hypothetical protein Tco_1529310 [Tanacetum coccineum]